MSASKCTTIHPTLEHRRLLTHGSLLERRHGGHCQTQQSAGYAQAQTVRCSGSIPESTDMDTRSAFIAADRKLSEGRPAAPDCRAIDHCEAHRPRPTV